MYDCIVIGAGVIGACVAREFSRFHIHTLVLEKEEDVCCGTSKANSGLVHAGFDARPGSLKARMNVRGSALMEQVCRELDVPFQRTGALVAAFGPQDEETLRMLLEQGKQNGVPELSILDAGEARELEPGLSEGATAALYAGTAGVVCPFELTAAMAENANVNGTEFIFLARVEQILTKENADGKYYEIHTVEKHGYMTGQSVTDVKKVYETKTVINCAGVFADVIHNMAGREKLRITPRRGQYCLLDRAAGGHVKHTVFRVPGPMGKGILVTPTVHGNLLLGPTAEDIEDREGTETSAEGLKKVLEGAGETVGSLPYGQVITSFAGLRAHEQGGDFVIGEAEGAPGFFDAAGIESPGLSSAPAIGEYLAGLAAEYLHAPERTDFIPCRKGIVHFAQLERAQQEKLLKARPEYGNVICRCETVTEAEVLDAVYRPLGARSLDGVKRRTRAGMGRCQSGFCSPKTAEILARAYRVPLLCVTKSGPGTELLAAYNKEVRP